MQPDTPAPVPADYDFIMNHGANAPKRSLLPGLGGSRKQRFIKIGLLGGIILLVILFFSSVVFGGNKNEALLGVAQTQQELIRISTLGTRGAKTSTARYLAYTTELTVLSNQKDVLAQMKKSGQKVKSQVLNAKKNAKTDIALSQAARNNRYDDVFILVMQQHLVEYQKLLKSTHDATSNQKIQQILNSEFNQAGQLLASTKSSSSL